MWNSLQTIPAPYSSGAPSSCPRFDEAAANNPSTSSSVGMTRMISAAGSGLSFGAATEKEVEMAELICELVPSIEMVRMVNSGTEAVMSALRAARGYTGRPKIVKFDGCYHGHCDAMLVKAGSGVMTAGVPSSAGVPAGTAEDTLTAAYNDLGSVRALLAANMGLVPPAPGFLQGLREITKKEGALLVFDEVITGFRLGLDGAQGFYGVQPDLTTFGKIIGAGMPVGAYGGRRDVMEQIAPVGPVYQAGTLSGNPVAMAAGLAQLRILKGHPEVYARAAARSTELFDGLREIIGESGAPCTVNSVGSQFEAVFLSSAHQCEDIERTLEVARAYFTR